MDRIGEALNRFVEPPHTRTVRRAQIVTEDDAPLFTATECQEIAVLLRTFIQGTAVANDMLAWIDRESRVGSKVPPAAVRDLVPVVEQLTRTLEKLQPAVQAWGRLSVKYDLLRLQIQRQYDAIDDHVFQCKVDAALLGIE
jgi:hypothetical protein